MASASLADGQSDQAGPLALIFSGEKAFTREAQMFENTTVFGEGAAACLVSAFGTRDRLLAYASNVRGEFRQRHWRERRAAAARIPAQPGRGDAAGAGRGWPDA